MGKVNYEEKEIKLRRELNALQESRIRETIIPKIEKLIGRCFKYDNSYGSGYSKSWPLYIKVLSRSKHTGIKTLKFQNDKKGILILELQQQILFHGEMGSGYTEISKKEFNAAFKNFASKITNLMRKSSANMRNNALKRL